MPLTERFRNAGDDPSRLDTMQVCENGHVVNDSVRSMPQFNRKFCEKCGAVTTTACKKCGKEIPGSALGSTLVRNKPPECCGECGEPFPWAVKKTQGKDSSMSNFAPGDKVRLKAGGGPEMVVDHIDPEKGVICAIMDEVKGSPRYVPFKEELLEKAFRQTLTDRLDLLEKGGRYVGPAKSLPSNRVFLVHGHDEAMKQEVARILSDLGLDPIILHERPNQGRTIIEKFEKNADVGFAVVLLCGDDMAYPAGTEHR